MDVKALLNASSSHPRQGIDSIENTPTPSATDVSTVPSPRLENSSPLETPSPCGLDQRPGLKNRTPWNAGGYSLPLSIDVKCSRIDEKAPFYTDSQVETGPFSTSSYSISSASNRSQSDSMASSPVDEMVASSTAISPMSTSHFSRPTFLGEEPHLEISTQRSPSSDSDAQLTARRPSFHTESEQPSFSEQLGSIKHKLSDSRSSLSSYAASSQSGCHSRISSSSTVSGTQPLTAFCDEPPRIFETPIDPREAIHLVRGDVKPPPVSALEQQWSTTHKLPPMAIDRPRSPSDAVLIPRAQTSGDGWRPMNGPGPLNQGADPRYLHPISSAPPRTHKRAISAPNFAAIVAPLPHHTLPPVFSSFGSSRASFSMPSAAQGASGPEPPTGLDIPCMFTPDCDTGAVRRKVISHMFGRNKLCTRMIPAHVWVHYCRKHYQRVRYRNGVEYSKLQVGLVLDQVKRVQAWSDENKANSRPGVVRDWSLQTRKREQKRLEDKSGKRDGEVDSDHETGATIDGAVLNGTAVPSWLLEKCGGVYQTDQIEEIISQLKTEIWDGRLQQIPDIELLPNIVDDDMAMPQQRKVTQKRKSVGGGNTHRRTQSMGVALQPEALPMVRRISQPNDYFRHGDEHDAHLEKRQRISDMRNERGSLPGMRRMHGLPHRPAFSNIRENQSEDAYYGQEAQLPAPTTGRDGGGVYNLIGRPMHSRSHSDASFMEASTFAGAPSSVHHLGIPFDGYGPSPVYHTPGNADFAVPPPSRAVYQQSEKQFSVGDCQRPFSLASQAPRMETPSRSPRLPPLSHHARHQSSPNNLGMIAPGINHGFQRPQPVGGVRRVSVSGQDFSSSVLPHAVMEETSPFRDHMQSQLVRPSIEEESCPPYQTRQ